MRVRILLPLPKRSPETTTVSGLLSCNESDKYPYFYPSQVYKALYVLFHTGRAILFHALRHMTINIQGKSRRGVSQVTLDSFHIVPILEGEDGESVPLRYNYDKPEKPRRIKGFEVFSLVFSSFSKPKNHTEISRIIGGVSLTTNE